MGHEYFFKFTHDIIIRGMNHIWWVEVNILSQDVSGHVIYFATPTKNFPDKIYPNKSTYHKD